MYRQGDLLLIPVPFSDLTSEKRRPVIVLSCDAYNARSNDLVIAAVTSNLRERAYAVSLEQGDLSEGVLPKPSCVRADKLYTLAQSMVVKRFGRVHPAKSLQVYEAVKALIKPLP